MRLLSVLLSCFLSGWLWSAPRIQPLVPGLIITPLPVELSNVDSLEYGPNGNLYTGGYDGRIHVLKDTDGDGIEDRAVVFWDQAGDLLTPVGILPRPEGVYVAARGKIALIQDTNGDGAGDVSQSIVSGWERESYNSDTRNDAAGLTMDSEGNLYFSLGCMSYNKAWQLDKAGRSRYDPSSERGTILKVSPDRTQREILATGLRFVIGLEFNRHGDLFATDQEGDTWFPGGNPRDELLHILPGRHYGFPFRHREHNPKVIDEPFVVGFSPQHQSTCGFRFNELRANRTPVGPSFWRGNAIVTGFSRGKLWRAPLAKTKFGYVGKQIQLLAFESLLTDVAISKNGTMVVASHSGKPDWGAGPTATGYLHSIQWDKKSPQPVIAWPSGPMETTIAFDRPIDLPKTSRANIEMGQHAWEGDRYEWIWPGYEVVKAEKAAPRRQLAVHQLKASDDRRTVKLTTAPHPWRARYRLEWLEAEASHAPLAELSYDLGGVEATWTKTGDSQASWTGWLPHIDPEVVRVLTTASSEHDKLRAQLSESGRLIARTQLQLPGREVRFRVHSTQPFSVTTPESRHQSTPQGSAHQLEFSLSASEDYKQASNARGGREQVLPSETVPIQWDIETGGKAAFAFSVGYQADFDPYWRPIRLEHLSVPWAPTIQAPQLDKKESTPSGKLAGNAQRGRDLFFGAEANCASCHQFNGEGANLAADLTVSLQRAPEAVMRDIVNPNAAINPDYVSYQITLKNGELVTGLVKDSSANALTVVDGAAQTHRIPRNTIRSLRASSTSLMPEGFAALGEQRLNDLVAFLCSGQGQE